MALIPYSKVHDYGIEIIIGTIDTCPSYATHNVHLYPG